MNNYLIIADDFTGANDTGLQIRRRGIPVRVFLSWPDEKTAGSCVLDTESRFLSEEEAFQKLLSAVKKIPFENFSRVFKKVDSTLRGNIGAETKALAETYKPDIIVFAPAFPDLGRTTVNRIHCISGTPVSRTEFASDSKAPVKCDDIRKIMEDAFPKKKLVHTGLDEIRKNKINLNTGEVFTFDAETNEDLQIIARTLLAQAGALRTERKILWIGSAGLADNLLNEELPVPPAMAVIGSLSSVTRSQVYFSERQGTPLVKIPLYAILEKAVSRETIADEAVSHIKNGKDVILLFSSVYSTEEYSKTEERARLSGFSPEAMSVFAQKTIGGITVLILEKAEVSGLFLSGGDTTVSCLEGAGAMGSEIEAEIAAGMPLVKLMGGKYDGLKVITKAGAFGKEDAISFGLRKLRERNEP